MQLPPKQVDDITVSTDARGEYQSDHHQRTYPRRLHGINHFCILMSDQATIQDRHLMGLTQRKTNHSIGLHPWKKFVVYNNDTLHRHKSETTYMSMDIFTDNQVAYF